MTYNLVPVCLLSTHANRQRVDISVTVCLQFCTVTGFSGEDKASGVKFCTVVHRRPGQGISYFRRELCSPEAQNRRRKIHAKDAPFVEYRAFARYVDVGSACGLYGRPRRRTYLFI